MRLGVRPMSTFVALIVVAPVLAGPYSGPQDGNAAASQDDSFRFLLPVTGTAGVDWVITKYFDHDPSSDFRDYRGGERSYNTHKGTDFAVPNFRWMDNEDLQVHVLAAADGRVIDLHDGEYDRQIEKGKAIRGNYVVIEHPDGFRTLYFHLKAGSIEVTKGQEVGTGTRLGVVGSSGNSNGPHLHFEVHDEAGRPVDPFRDELWEDAPAYDIATTVMDYTVMASRMERPDLRDPPENATSISPGKGVISVAACVVYAKEGDELKVVLRNGTTTHVRTKLYDRFRSDNRKGWRVDVNKRSGVWHISFYINDKPTGITHEVRVASR